MASPNSWLWGFLCSALCSASGSPFWRWLLRASQLPSFQPFFTHQGGSLQSMTSARGSSSICYPMCNILASTTLKVLGFGPTYHRGFQLVLSCPLRCLSSCFFFKAVYTFSLLLCVWNIGSMSKHKLSNLPHVNVFVSVTWRWNFYFSQWKHAGRESLGGQEMSIEATTLGV